MEVVMKALISILSLLFLFSPAGPVQAAEMSSATFIVEADGLSCGGRPAFSASFRTTITLGQSTPLRLKTYPKSFTFRNLPGLRYQLEDVEGMEITEFGKGFLPSIYQLLLLDED
jgi:hypothetical protein